MPGIPDPLFDEEADCERQIMRLAGSLVCLYHHTAYYQVIVGPGDTVFLMLSADAVDFERTLIEG